MSAQLPSKFEQACSSLRVATERARCWGLAPVVVAPTDGDPREVVPAAKAFAAELRRLQLHFAMDAVADLDLDTTTPDEGTLKRARFSARVTATLKVAADFAVEHAVELEAAVDEAIRQAIEDGPED